MILSSRLDSLQLYYRKDSGRMPCQIDQENESIDQSKGRLE